MQTSVNTFYETLPEAQRTQGIEKEKMGVLDFDIFIVVTIEKTIKLDCSSFSQLQICDIVCPLDKHPFLDESLWTVGRGPKVKNGRINI